MAANDNHVNEQKGEGVSAPPSCMQGVTCRCPKCGQGSIYEGMLRLRAKCLACGFDLGAADPGDGPAFLVITLMGFLVTGLAVWVELAYAPSLWWHSVWLPFTLLGSVYLLRVSKSLLLHYQYRLNIGFRD